LHTLVSQVFIEGHQPVNGTLGRKFDHPGGNRLHEGMVMGCHQYNPWEIDTAFIETLDALQIKVVGRLIKNNTVGILEHHAAHHAPYFFSPAQDLCFLGNIISTEQHFA
jgi:hypothetical protein